MADFEETLRVRWKIENSYEQSICVTSFFGKRIELDTKCGLEKHSDLIFWERVHW